MIICFKRARWFLIAAAAVAAGTGCAFLETDSDAARPFLRYRLMVADRGLETVRVSVSVFGAPRGGMLFRKAGEGVRHEPLMLGAADTQKKPLAVGERDGGWFVENGGRDFTLSYDVVLTIEDRYSPEIRGMITCLDENRIRLIGRDIFLVPELSVSDGILVDVEAFPDSELRSAFKTVGGRMIVPNLEQLASVLAVRGDYRYLVARRGGIELGLAIACDWNFGDEEFFAVIRSIVAAETAMFGSSPHESYLFVCDRNPVRGGAGFDSYGMHFGANMLLLLDRMLDRSGLYDTPMSIIAHEFFHNWNGEALSPRSDDFLWFTEGATVYFSYQALLSANIISRKQYEWRRRTILERYRENSRREHVPIADAANNDLGDKDMVNLLYDGGFLAAEALDERIAAVSEGRTRLIDVLRWLYENERGGIDEGKLVRAIAATSGYDLSTYVSELVHEPATALISENPRS